MRNTSGTLEIMSAMETKENYLNPKREKYEIENSWEEQGT